jgi:hypothetical protein
MSFASFGPLPKPQPNPIPGLPALEAAIRRLEATIPTSPSDSLSTSGEGEREISIPLSTCGEGRGEVGAGRRIWQVVAALLARLDPDARPYLHRVFARTLEAVEDDLALPPERRRLIPKPLSEQERGRPSAQETALRCAQGQPGIDRLLRQALWRAVDALEAAALVPPGEDYLALLVEQGLQFERVYQALKRRANSRCIALWIIQGEVKLLRHRGSAVIESLLFD